MPLFGAIVGEGEAGGPGVAGVDPRTLRLTDVQLRHSLSDRDERLRILDIFREDLIFHTCLLYTSPSPRD